MTCELNDLGVYYYHVLSACLDSDYLNKHHLCDWSRTQDHSAEASHVVRIVQISIYIEYL